MKIVSTPRSLVSRAKITSVVFLFLLTYVTSAVAPFIPAPVTNAESLSTGYHSPTATTAPSANGWTVSTVQNIQADDDVYVSEGPTSGNNGGGVQFYNAFNLGIPANATINGMEVEVRAKSTDPVGCRLGMRLVWNGSDPTNNDTGTRYAQLADSESVAVLGDPTNTWGHIWTSAQMANDQFGILLEDDDAGIDCDNGAITSVDELRVNVHYFVPAAPVTNPPLVQACGLDIALVIDNSTSIETNEMDQMKSALTSFTGALAGTPTEVSVTRFATTAGVIQPFTSNITAVNAAINGVPTGGGYTNWEAGLLAAQSTFATDRTDHPDLIIFATDGDPTASNTGGPVNTNQPNAHLEPAIVAANGVKRSSIRILTLGIGLGNNTSSVDRLKQISGANVNTGIITSDVITTNFSTLAQDLAAFAEQTCGGTITTEKLIDADGNPNTTGDQTPAANWQFDVNGGSNPDPTVTDTRGLTPAVPVTAGSGYSVVETAQPGYAVIAASCTGANANGAWSGNAVTGLDVARNNVVHCTFVNTLQKGKLRVVKDVVNDNGGTKTYADFHFVVNGGAPQTFDATTSPDGAKEVELPIGTYAVTEPEANTMGYATTYTNCASVVVAANQTATCTIKNDDRPGTLIVNKIVINDNGGTKQASDFQFKVNGGTATSFEADGSNLYSVNAGVYDVTELPDSAYSTRYDNCAQIAVPVGGTATCTITNNDKPATLTLVKTVINNQGGTLRAGDFPVYIGTMVSSWGSQSINAGTYTVSETQNPNYTASSWGGDCTEQGRVTLSAGDDKTCTITNDDKPAMLSGIKSVANQDMSWVTSGMHPVSGWVIYLDQNQNGVLDADERSTTTDASGGYSFGNLIGGITYYVKEVVSSLGAGWEQVGAPEPVNLAVGGNSTENNFANKAFGNLSVIKNTVDAEGTVHRDVDGWTWNYDGVENDGLAQAASSTNVKKVAAGTYTVSENTQTNYTVVSSACSGETNTAVSTSKTVVVSPGENVVCTFTNKRDTGSLIVKKHVINNNGGTAAAGDFTLHVKQNDTDIAGSSFAGSESGKTFASLATGTYAVSESDLPDGYAQTRIVCNGVETDSVQVAKDSVTICVVTNDDVAPKLTVVKTVDNTGTNLTKTADDFTMNITATNPSDDSFAGSAEGTTITLDQGAYTVTETADPNYEVSYSSNCDGTIQVGDEKTCYVTNKAILKPGIQVVKSGPATAHEGDVVTYTFTVTNTGNTPFYDHTVIDDIAGEADYVMGDTNNNGDLDPGETWTFTADYTIPAGQTANVVNTVTACGYDYSEQNTEDAKGTCDTDTHILDVLHPAIKVVKSGPDNAQLGTTGTFTFVVTNAGDTALGIAEVTDNIAGAGSYISGDANSNSMLDLAETWVYQATYRFTSLGTVENTVTVCSEDSLEAEVCSTDKHKTIVYQPQVLGDVTPPAPKLQDTGTSLLWQTIAGVALVALGVWVVVRPGKRATYSIRPYM